MGSLNIIDRELVKTVRWDVSPDTYDLRLHLLNTDFDEFIVVNPIYENWILNYIDTSIDSDRCLMWVKQDKWIAKKFKRGWTPADGWQVIETDFKTESITEIEIVEKLNTDLPLYLFDDINYEIKLEDINLEHTWLLDYAYTNGPIWVKTAAATKHPTGIKQMGYVSPNIAEELDVIFISYDETNAEANWQRVLKKCPFAQRVHGVKGIFEAHKTAAALAQTDMFYVVDGDAELLDDFYFNHQPNIWNRDTIHVWKSRNPINNLEYGYGGVKLFPKYIVDNASTWSVDMTTSVGFKLKVMNTVSNITKFNTDPFSTWRSAFRECAKLAAGTIKNQIADEDDERLSRWCSDYGRDSLFGDYAIQGARLGRKYGLDNKDNPAALKMINDRQWLKEKFDETA
jgi:hypothetical protein